MVKQIALFPAINGSLRLFASAAASFISEPPRRGCSITAEFAEKDSATMAAAAAESSPPPSSRPHAAIFPFLSKGHIIPLLHLARLLHHRRLATFTFITTPLNAPIVRSYLDDLPSESGDVVLLPFPCDAPGLPPGIESTDQLPSMSAFLMFLETTKLLRPYLQKTLASLSPPASFLVSDLFYDWTVESARELGIPRFVFSGMGWCAMTVLSLVTLGRSHAGVASEIEPLQVPVFSRIQLTKADLFPPFDDPDASGPLLDVVIEHRKAMVESNGIIVNSFYEMEAAFADHWNGHLHPKGWSVGPLCLSKPEARSLPTRYAEWLEDRLAVGRSVLYVSFGTQAELSRQQLEELAWALKNSGLDFFWVLRQKEGTATVGFEDIEERVAGRGLVARDWVPQMDVLSHAAVRGFLSHCGWNSVLESICAGVPILAWPLTAEQHLNAKMVVEELGIGLRVRTTDGTLGALVRRECIEEMARALLLGEEGKKAAAKVSELGVAARQAIEEGGSSWCTLEEMVEAACWKVGTGRNGDLQPAVPPTDPAEGMAGGRSPVFSSTDRYALAKGTGN